MAGCFCGLQELLLGKSFDVFSPSGGRMIPSTMLKSSQQGRTLQFRNRIRSLYLILSFTLEKDFYESRFCLCI